MRSLVLLILVAACLWLAGPVHAGKLEDIKARKTLLVGVYDAVAPFGYVDEMTNLIIGYDVDIARRIAKALDVRLELTPVTEASRVDQLQDGQVDILAAAMPRTHATESELDFSFTYFMNGYKLLTRREAGVASAADLAGKTVAAVKGSEAAKAIKKAQPKSKVRTCEADAFCFLALKAGEADAMIGDVTSLLGLKNVDDAPDNWDIVGEYLNAKPCGLGLPENDSDFRDAINKILNEMLLSGEFDTIYQTWFGPDTLYPVPREWEMQRIPF